MRYRRNWEYGEDTDWMDVGLKVAAAAVIVVPIIAWLASRRARAASSSGGGGSQGLPDNAQSQANFGPLEFVPDPQPNNPEAVRITNGWDNNNVVSVYLPDFGRTVQFHKKCAPHIKELFAAWGQAGLIPQILQWGGTWVPRFVRGSKTKLSNHAFATAFDINMQWNPMGQAAAAPGEYGNVQELAAIAKNLGWRWGGDYVSRVDGMHFERLSC